MSNLLVNLPVKEFWIMVNIWQSYGQDYSGSSVIWHKAALIPHTDGWIVFAWWRHCAALSNNVLLDTPSAGIPNWIATDSVVSAQLMEESPCTLSAVFLPPQKLPMCIGESWPPFNTWFLGPPESTSQMTFRSVQPFLQGSRSSTST